jgi:hypothetical protein
MSFRKLSLVILSASALLMSLHIAPASAHDRYDRDSDRRDRRDRYEHYRHDDWGWYDNSGRYHRYDSES